MNPKRFLPDTVRVEKSSRQEVARLSSLPKFERPARKMKPAIVPFGMVPEEYLERTNPRIKTSCGTKQYPNKMQSYYLMQCQFFDKSIKTERIKKAKSDKTALTAAKRRITQMRKIWEFAGPQDFKKPYNDTTASIFLTGLIFVTERKVSI